MQLTGRYRYKQYAREMAWPLVEQPGIANEPWAAAALLARYLRDHETSIRDALQRGDLRSARRAVNGGSNGLNEFILAFHAGQNFLREQVAGRFAGHANATGR